MASLFAESLDRLTSNVVQIKTSAQGLRNAVSNGNDAQVQAATVEAAKPWYKQEITVAGYTTTNGMVAGAVVLIIGLIALFKSRKA